MLFRSQGEGPGPPDTLPFGAPLESLVILHKFVQKLLMQLMRRSDLVFNLRGFYQYNNKAVKYLHILKSSSYRAPERTVEVVCADRSGVLLTRRGQRSAVAQSQPGRLRQLGVVLRVDVVEDAAATHLYLASSDRGEGMIEGHAGTTDTTADTDGTHRH